MKKNYRHLLIMLAVFYCSLTNVKSQVITGYEDKDPEKQKEKLERAEAMLEKMKRIVPRHIGNNELTLKTAHFALSNYSAMYTGMADLAGIGEMPYRALFSSTDTLSNFQINFPLSSKIKPPSFNALNKLAPDWSSFYLPSFIRERLVIDSCDIKFHNSGVGLESTYFGLKVLEDWQLFDGVDIKFSKIALGFITKYPDKDAEQKFEMAGNMTAYFKWRDNTEISLGSTLTKDIKEWVITGELRTFTLNDVLKIFHVDDLAGAFVPPVILEQGTSKTTIDIYPYKGVELTALTTLGNLNIVVERQTVDKKPMSTMLSGGYNPKPSVVQAGQAKLSTATSDGSSSAAKSSTLSTILTGPYVPPTETKGHKWGLMAGFSLPENFKFSEFSPALKILDDFQAYNAGLYFSTFEAAPQNSLPIFKNLGAGNPTVYKGVTFIIGVNTKELREHKAIQNLADWPGIDFVCFSGNIPANPVNFTLGAGINLSDEINIGNRIFFPYFEIGIEPTNSGGRKFSLWGFMNVVIDKKTTLEFKARGSLDPGTASVNMGGALLNEWRNPFGIKGFSFGEMEIGAGIDFSKSPIPLPDDISLAGKLYFGKISGKARIGIDVNETGKNHFIGELNKVSWTNLIDYLFEEQVKIKLPSYLKPYFNSELRNAKIKFVPPGAGTIRTLTNETLTPGFGIGGDGQFAGWEGKFELALEGYESGIDAGIKASALADPINISVGDFAIFKLTGVQGSGKPEMKVDLTAGNILKGITALPNKTVPATATSQPDNRFVYVNGGLTILGVTNANAFINLGPEGYLCQLDGKVYGFLDARIDAQIKSFINPLENTYVKVEGKAGGLVKDLQKLLTKEILDLGFSLDRIYFAGRLDGLKTGAKAKLEYRVAGRNNSMDVYLTVGGAADLAKQIAKEIGNVGGVVLKEVKDAAEKAVAETIGAAEKAARDFANFTDESARKTWNKSLKEMGDLADDFSGVIDKMSGKTERKLIKINGPTYLIHTKFPGQLLQSESSKETEHHVYLGSYMNRLQDTWQIVPAGNSGYCYIVSAYSALNLNVDDHRKEDGAMIRLMKHKLEDRNNERIKLVMVPNEVGWYYLQFQHSGKYATLSGGPVAKGIPVANTHYFIMAKHSNLTLETDGGNLRQNEQNSTPEHQAWSLVPAGTSDVFYIKHENTGTYVTIDVKDNKPAPGQNVSRQKLASSAAQKFRLIPAGNEGYYKLVSLLGNELVLDIKNASLDNGARMQAWTDNGNYAQHFYFVPVNRTRINQTSSTGDASKFRFEQVGTRTW